ncbi:sensor histidine kinase [Pannonibacter indicus]|uniref:sensor histidine kinase n=1 Tax=Pannonibacter indicus TaxID=466044 RepID=UPI00391C28AD
MSRSVRGRLILWGGALTALALVLAWAALSALLSDFVARRLAAELASAARGIMAAAEWDEDTGAFRLSPPPAGPRFEAPRSGWFWQVADGQAVLARSPSLLSADLGSEGAGTEAHGLRLVAHAERFTAPGDGRDLIVAVTLPSAAAEAELAAIRRPLALALAVLGAVLLAAQLLAVRAGLTDLTRFTSAISQMRDGGTAALPEPRATELAPLAAELARLVEANRAQIARAREQAADLAHALKTPLAVLANRAGPEDRALIERMERMLRWHLGRARSAGRPAGPAARAPVGRVLEDVALVVGPAARRQGLSLTVASEDAPDFRGDAEDLAEMVGALAENAAKWACGTVRLAAHGQDGRLIVEIADDGPGIPEPERARLMARGARLDSVGHGLGLAIAADRARACGGTLTLGQAPEGGLLARLGLPAAGT